MEGKRGGKNWRNLALSALLVLAAGLLLAAAFFAITSPEKFGDRVRGAAAFLGIVPRPAPELPTPMPVVVESGRPCAAELEGKEYGWACNGGVLEWKECKTGLERELSVNCSFDSGGRTGYCNPSHPLRPSCDATTVAAPTVSPAAGEPAALTPTPPPTVSPTAIPLSFCGNGFADASERCDTCPADYWCGAGEYCDNETGLCGKKEVCGDDNCTAAENRSRSCCGDCGCAGGLLCNEATMRCQQPANIPDHVMDAVLDDYLARHANYSLANVFDTFYAGVPVKAASFDCAHEYPACRTVLFIAANGTVLEEARTT